VLPYPAVSLRIAPFVPELHGVSRATKSADYDDTIVLGDEASQLAGRGLLAALVAQLSKQGAADSALLDLTLPLWERSFHRAVVGLGLEALRISPHCLRHGAASSDFASKFRRLDELQRRGRWKAAASVRRYEKCGRLSGQVAMMSAELLEKAATLSATLPSALGLLSKQLPHRQPAQRQLKRRRT
jgi:hypothetical protein